MAFGKPSAPPMLGAPPMGAPAPMPMMKPKVAKPSPFAGKESPQEEASERKASPFASKKRGFARGAVGKRFSGRR